MRTDSGLKKNRTKIQMVLTALVILSVVRQFFLGNYHNMFLGILTLILFMVPQFLDRKLSVTIPPGLETVILIFIFSAEILGEINAFYVKIPIWDTILHTTNGFLMAAIGFALIDLFNRSDRFSIGSSVGPEAGLTGIIVGLCYWVGDNLKFARQNTRNYSQIGAAVSMSVLFHAPLFGIFEVEENSEEDLASLTKGSKVFLYGIALAAGTGIYAGLSALFGAGLSGFPSFDMVEIQRKDYLLMILYILCGLILACFYQATHKLTRSISSRFPAVVKEIFAGICLGVTGSFLPALMFSGEEQMGALMKTYTSYLPLALIGIAFLKLLLTNLCIQFGLKGGHFFPVIFAGVCMGYGMAMLTCGPDGGHVVFGAAIVTASLLGGIMKQ